MPLLPLVAVIVCVTGCKGHLHGTAEEGLAEAREAHFRIGLQRPIVVGGREIIRVTRQGRQIVQGPVLRQTNRGIEGGEGFIPEKGDAPELGLRAGRIVIQIVV